MKKMKMTVSCALVFASLFALSASAQEYGAMATSTPGTSEHAGMSGQDTSSSGEPGTMATPTEQAGKQAKKKSKKKSKQPSDTTTESSTGTSTDTTSSSTGSTGSTSH